MSIHTFEPSLYYNTMGSHEPVLYIKDGDSVVTSTIDSRGKNKNLRVIASPPNPVTGPFFIEGAEPGDTLAVCFDHMKPNRNSGWTGNIVAPHLVNAEEVVNLPQRELIDWDFDLKKDTAQPSKPISGLSNIQLKIEPFLGCFGVAPARGEMISTASSAEHGGNMDYRGFQAGVTAYFPVFEPGALFYLGDSHARQGDGEIIGTGIETSFEVQFTVHLIKEKRIGWPRGEDENHIFTIGNARPLELALQHATTEMLQWLREDYGLDHVAASVLLGHCVQYDIGNVYNPAYTLVCKLPKDMLGKIETS
ncbi:acetamidase/formamidase family protein [Bacillus sp. FJAT-50079]|uniref:acetamidase/formamidase family protein n=1 Tax=Bacillus sp. FJAT-50079 TaxID=2833577 RepID=UPI001BC9D69E|nr:acetamidase/formamidase family protein [Bacillus sp. FJAT-50079]MBS4209372.1 acetamidase/formamidase family protein [Bacillus sp. FJAT-50079]